jgi:hypothetical protein
MAQIANREGSSSMFQAAQRACAKYYGHTAPPQHVSPQEMQKLLAASRCMRTHGVPSFPDPNPITGELTTPVGIDKFEGTFAAFLERARGGCRSSDGDVPFRAGWRGGAGTRTLGLR